MFEEDKVGNSAVSKAAGSRDPLTKIVRTFIVNVAALKQNLSTGGSCPDF